MYNIYDYTHERTYECNKVLKFSDINTAELNDISYNSEVLSNN
jgi:hypothetical protein